MIVSPSMSLVIAGIASGICFYFLSTNRKGKPKDVKRVSRDTIADDTRCACCLKPFLVDRGVRCSDCAARSCRKVCSRWDTEENAWHCLFCHQQRCWQRRKEKWFETYGGELEEVELHRFFNTAKSRVYVAGVENAATISGSDLAAESQEEAHTMETVRDFVEKIVEGLIGNVDDTPIDRIYDHPAYDKLFAAFIVPLAGALTRLAVALQLSLTNKPTTDPPTMAHTALRDIVERAVEEARKLPGLSNSTENRTTEEGRSIAEHSYEDLLATAILNKVIEKFQREQVDGNSNVLHENLSLKSKRSLSESEAGLDEGVEEGCSSLEPLSPDECSDCSASCSRRIRNRPEPLSLTIEERIEEVTTTYASDEEPRENDVLLIRNAHRVPFPELGMDIIDPSQESEDSQDEPDTPTPHMELVSPVESWEENWLFQKKKVQKQADPVAMLVPNPSADFKALIGDKDAEDTSDLSECSSAQSDEEIEKELMEAINNVVPRTPKKNELDNELEIKVQSVNHFEFTPPISVADCDDDDKNSRLTNKISEECERKNETNETKEMKVDVDFKEVASDSKELIRQFDNKSNDGAKSEDEVIPNTESCQSSASQTGNWTFSIKDTIAEEEQMSEEIERNEFGNSDNLTSPALEDAAISTVPKTPVCTPIRTSVNEEDFDNENDAESLENSEENVLNSLECAKKKLMANEEDDLKKLAEEEAKESTHQKVDIHAEDAQQESEYTEHYDIATQRHLDSLTKTDSVSVDEGSNDMKSEETLSRDSKPDNGACKYQSMEPEASNGMKPASLLQKETIISAEEPQLATPPRPGTIAEREHKKWENAPPIENNPYSEESIQKRLWERQYARRLSDIPGAHTELPKSNGVELEVDLTPNQPDITRFGRDYYINHSKAACGERVRRSGSSRPSSSLSQRSNSTTGAEHEQQEEAQFNKETDSTLNRTNDVKSKVAKWQNNVEVNYQSIVQRSDSIKSYTTETSEEKYLTKNDVTISNQKIWEDKRVEELLENERKNSKNEINAKLNNQESYENGSILETKKTYSEEQQKKIRRIDLKAYGFENEFFVKSSEIMRKTPQRVVNKLDLKSFGYDGGLRRSQSNNHLDSTVNEPDFKPRMIRVSGKSNLSRNGEYHKISDCHSLVESGDSTDSNLTQSTESLNKLQDENYSFYGMLKSAKSVPNITKCEYYSTSSIEQEYEDIESYTLQNSANDTVDGSTSQDEKFVNSEMHYSFEKDQNYLSRENVSVSSNKEEIVQKTVNRLPLPSVRRLAEAFSKQPEALSSSNSKETKTNGICKGRASTPEIQIVETPRQMHSLTARSLSKKFREGLRQIPNKVTSPPASHVAMEQSKTVDNQTDVIPSKVDRGLSDTDVISPGKLKSNIIFWEQMQRRS